nr:hypothetical protein [Tanacetum cinerariifolium]
VSKKGEWPRTDITLVDKKKVIITKDSIRSDLRFDDAEGTTCLPNEAIFKGLERIGTMESAIICLADNQKFNFSKYIVDNMVKSLEGGIKFYLFPRFLQVFLDNQVEGMARHKEMYVISSHTKKIFANMRRIREGFSRVVTPLFDTMMVKAAVDMGDTPIQTHQTLIVDQPSTSRPQKKQKPRRKQRKEAEVSHYESEDKDHVPTPSSDLLHSGKDSYTLNELMVFCTSLQEHMFDLQEAKDAQSKEIAALKKKGRMIKEIDQDDEIALYADTHGRKNDDEMFEVDDLSREEVVLDITTGEHEEQIIEDVSTAEPVTTTSEVVTTVADKVSAAPTTDATKDKITMDQALAALKSTKPKVVILEQEVSTTIPAVTPPNLVDSRILNIRGRYFIDQ